MKRVVLLLFLSIIFVFALFAEGDAILKEVVGKVEYKPEGGTWQTANEGEPIYISDTIATGFNSHAVLDFGTSTITFKPLTRMTVDKYLEDSGKLNTSLYLRVGKVRAEVKSSEEVRQDFKIVSPYSTASVRGSIADIDNGRQFNAIEGEWRITQSNQRDIQEGAGRRRRGGDEEEGEGEDEEEAAEDEEPADDEAPEEEAPDEDEEATDDEEADDEEADDEEAEEEEVEEEKEPTEEETLEEEPADEEPASEDEPEAEEPQAEEEPAPELAEEGPAEPEPTPEPAPEPTPEATPEPGPAPGAPDAGGPGFPPEPTVVLQPGQNLDFDTIDVSVSQDFSFVQNTVQQSEPSTEFEVQSDAGVVGDSQEDTTETVPEEDTTSAPAPVTGHVKITW
jgi:hypothetical protein